MDKSITIYNVQGENILTTPVKADSKRAFELMNHDYIKLLFSLYTPVSIPLGAYCDTDFGRFELTDLYNPAYNTSTGGYDYELQLDAQYRKWKNKIFKYRPAYGGQEASWSLTASLDVQMNVFLDNLKALGYTYSDTAKSDYVVEISTDVENTAKAMSYSNTSLLDALTSLANTWECEWWITGNVIHFGKAKSGTPVELVIGENVENMEPSDSRDTYATRIYPFGSTQNLSSKYRKELIFDITNEGTVRDVTVDGTEYLGIDVYDQFRPVYADFFPESERKETKVSPFTPDLDGGSRVDDFDDFSNTGEYTGTFGILARREVTIRNKIDFDDSAPGHLSDFYYIESVEFTFIGYRRKGNLEEKLSCVVKSMKLVYPEGSKRADIDITDTVLKGKRVKFYKTQTCIPDVVTTLLVGKDISELAEISKPFREVITFWPQGTFRSAARSVVCEAVTVSGVNAGKTYKCIVNPKFVVEADTYDRNEMYFLLQGGRASDMPDKGDRFTLTKIQRFLTPSSYFTDATPGDVTKAGVVERRLMLPKGIPYVPYIENDTTPQEQIVEAVAVFDDIYPKREGAVSAVSTFTRTDEEEMDDGSKKKTQWEAYVIEDAAFSFDKDWQIEGTTLQFVFSSGLLNGMTFDVNFHPSGWIDPDNTLHDTQCWEIVRNEDYGRPIPDSVLCPKVGDGYVLLNFDSTAIDETGYVEAAEQKLYEEAMKLYNESKEDPSTYTVTMMSDCVYSPDGIHNLLKVGDQVTLKNPAYFPEEGRISRVIGYEFNLDMPYDSPVYTIGNTPKYSRLDALEEKIDGINYNGKSYTSLGGSSTTGGTSVYVISSTDTDTPRTDKNVYSAKAIDKQAAEAKAEAERKFLRKDRNDQTDFPLDVRNELSCDTLTVRKRATFAEVLIKQIQHAGGELVLTPASMVCSRVEETDDAYRCYFRSDDGERVVYNEFRVGDQARCQTFNIKAGTYEGVTNRYYWRLVTAVGEDWIDLSKTDCDPATDNDVPAKGDHIVQLGNPTDTERQGAIILSTVGTDAPSFKQYNGIDGYTLTGKEGNILSRTLNRLIGDFIAESTGTNISDDMSAMKELFGQQVDELDGKISQVIAATDTEYTLWFYPYDPSAVTLPEAEWTDDATRGLHVGDIFYNEDSGHAFRYERSDVDGSFGWTAIADRQTLLALERAAKAQDTADSKRRTFVAQPTDADAYDAGDIWVNATYPEDGSQYKNDLLRCTTSKKAGATFCIDHWTSASEVTSAVISAIDGRVTAVANRFNADGSLKNRAGLVAEDDFSSLFAEAVDADTDIVKRAEVDTFVKKDADGNVEAGIRLKADQIEFLGKTMINGNFVVDAEGNVTMKNFKAIDGEFSGKVEATGGKIGGFSIANNGDLEFTYKEGYWFRISVETGDVQIVPEQMTGTSFYFSPNIDENGMPNPIMRMAVNKKQGSGSETSFLFDGGYRTIIEAGEIKLEEWDGYNVEGISHQYITTITAKGGITTEHNQYKKI